MSKMPEPYAESSLGTIGNTPLLKLNRLKPEDSADIYIKLEYFSPTGSYKDRMALSMIEEAEKRGVLRPGMTVVEYTGGSTGTSLAFVCAVKGYRFKVVSSDAFSKEKLDTMRAFGADLTLIPSKDGKVTPDLVPRMIKKANEFASDENTYFTNQLYNNDSLVGYRKIGEEISRQMDRKIDCFCASVGTAGLLVGVSEILKKANNKNRIVAFEPASSAVISTGKAGTHSVEGIGIGFVPPLLEEANFDEARGINEDDAKQMTIRLAREEGVFSGKSTGLNVVGALQLAKELGPDHTVVTVAVDTGLKYLAGNLFGD